MLVLCSTIINPETPVLSVPSSSKNGYQTSIKQPSLSTNSCPLLKYNTFNSHAGMHNFQCSFPKLSLDGQSNIKYKPSTLKNANFPPNIPPHVPTKIRSKKKCPKNRYQMMILQA